MQAMQVSLSLHTAGKKIENIYSSWHQWARFQLSVAPTKILLAQKVCNFHSLSTDKTPEGNFTCPLDHQLPFLLAQE